MNHDNVLAEPPVDKQHFALRFKWTVSRARETYGYNVCTLYVDGHKVARCNGGGYDMEGTVLGLWLAKRFADQLCANVRTPIYGLTFHDPDFDPARAKVPGTEETVAAMEAAGKSFGLERYQALFAASSPLPTPTHRVPYLDGAVGKDNMLEALKAIGGAYHVVHTDAYQTTAWVAAPATIQAVRQEDRSNKEPKESEARAPDGHQASDQTPTYTAHPRDTPTSQPLLTKQTPMPERPTSQADGHHNEKAPGPEPRNLEEGLLMSEKDKPEAKLACGSVRGVIWLNESAEGDQDHTISIARVYRAKDGSTKTTHSFREGDLADLIELARGAQSIIQEEALKRGLEQPSNAQRARISR
jgi:hypothetical protein